MVAHIRKGEERMALECEYYDNDEIMAALGRQVVDQYISAHNLHGTGVFLNLTGPASYITTSIGEYIQEEVDRKDCADCQHHAYETWSRCFCTQKMDEHDTCCEAYIGSDHLDDAADCPNFSEGE